MDDPENTAITGHALDKPKDTRFKPGTSGNPGGRPKLPDEVKQALLAATPDAVATLVNIINDPKAKNADRIRASEVVLDRVLGKSVQPLTGPDGEGPIQVAALVVLPAPTDE